MPTSAASGNDGQTWRQANASSAANDTKVSTAIASISGTGAPLAIRL
jgi:hypothetical protein